MDALERVLDERREELNDFTKRYDQGPPDEGYADEEVRSRYEQVASRLPERDFEESARVAFDRMAPEERREFYEQLRNTAVREGISSPELSRDATRYEDSRALAGLTSKVHIQQPELLSGLAGSNLANSALKSGFAGIAASAIRRHLR
jgi:hypothetical protein